MFFLNAAAKIKAIEIGRGELHYYSFGVLCEMGSVNQSLQAKTRITGNKKKRVVLWCCRYIDVIWNYASLPYLLIIPSRANYSVLSRV